MMDFNRHWIRYGVLFLLMLSSLCMRTTSGAQSKDTNELDSRLLVAADNGDMGAVRTLLESGANVNCHDELWTPLIHAIWNKKTQMALFLIDKGADINAVTHLKYSPLIAALSQKDHTMATLLLKRGADVKVCDPEGETTLMLAVRSGDIALVREFVARGVDVNQSNIYGHPPLLLAIRNLRMLKLLLSHGANPNSSTHFDHEDSVFMVAAGGGALAAAKTMLDYGAKVNQEGRYGRRPLDFAVANKDKAMIRLLKKHHAVVGTGVPK